ncbi:MAG: Cysteine-tRNA ligase [Candidatus Roizmanbacteria bacterium GW2011_GWA1_41_13]|uniref:Cysteine--tRNA ligase n=1 Tax=Candidatus Roizmanbacteria bacterium GW2011_GWA1_41_13 TaxID=1618474 RepID=A0A0G0UQ38_9BACT|nr:MAG: Cysteine-tRNA ligase [Candidatus Roizmanbacteria bacterium GW2011_GWA1_41_13]
MLQLYNSLTRKNEPFEPINPPHVSLYTCGPTVYDYPHIGHGRKYVMDDILKRTLTAFGYEVKHVQNITDVGHLVSDADEGEDKLEKGAKREKKTVWQVAKYYEDEFNKDMKKLNILPPDYQPRATEHIQEQINIIHKLFEKGYAYDTPEAVYFDVTKFNKYSELFGQSLEDKQIASREKVKTGEHKKHSADFALWFKRVGRFSDHTMHWESPWGDGFPGWHIECSAMSMKYLGETIDIHTGGIDHLSIHHPNEIAQSEGATGKQFVRFWMHYNFLTVDRTKMSKSLGNFYRIQDVEQKGFDPLDLRYFYLTANYRTQQNFTWVALESAKSARNKLMNIINQLRSGGIYDAKNKSAMNRATTNFKRTILSPEKLQKTKSFQEKFSQAIENDLNTPEALAVVWGAVKSNIPSEDKYDLLMSFDEILGLRLSDSRQQTAEKTVIPHEIQSLLDQRAQLRKEKKFNEADQIRKQIEDKGYIIEDMSTGQKVRAIKSLDSLMP